MMPEPVAPRPSAEDRIRAATWFAEQGFGVFSVWGIAPSGACRCPKGAGCDNAGKHPIARQGFLENTRDPAVIRTLLSAASEPNYGLVCPDGVFVLDVDGDGVARLRQLQDELGWLPLTLTTKTANGFHIFMRWPADLPRPIGQLFGYVTRWGSGANAGYVIGPRSIHASGVAYTPGESFDIAELPRAWAESVLHPAPSTDGITVQGGGYELPEAGYRGSRYDAIREFVASRYMRGISKEEIATLVLYQLAPRFAEPLTEPDLLARFERAWKGTPERLGPPLSPRNAPGPAKAVGPGIDAADLLKLDLPPLRWVVPELVPEGTTILAAPPKVGKSCLIYQIAVEAAIGGDLLGRRVSPGSVLYLALEDGKRRGQQRLRTALAGRTMPAGRLEVQWDARDIGAGLEDDLTAWLDSHPDAVMVAIDTLGKVRPAANGKSNANAYDVDVAMLARLQDIFRDRPVALVIVHHARKDAHDDFLASVSGTYGITGSADTIVVVRRPRNELYGKIYVTGRDVADGEFPVQFVGGRWEQATGGLPGASTPRREVYRVISESPVPIMALAIAKELDMERTNVQHLIGGLVDDGDVVKVTRKGVTGYVPNAVTLITQDSELPLLSPLTPLTQTGTNSEWSEGRENARAREAGTGEWVTPCRDYRNHQSSHVQVEGRWTCTACQSEGQREDPE